MGDEPGAQVGAAAHKRAGSWHQAGTVAPGQPHLFTARVEGHRKAGQHPVCSADRFALQKQIGLGVNEGRRRAVGNGHAFGYAGGSRGEDNPGVIARCWNGSGGIHQRRVVSGRYRPCLQRLKVEGGARHEHTVLANNAHHLRLGEHQLGALVGVVSIDRNVGGPHE